MTKPTHMIGYIDKLRLRIDGITKDQAYTRRNWMSYDRRNYKMSDDIRKLYENNIGPIE